MTAASTIGIGETEASPNKMLMIESFIALICFGMRLVLSRYVTKVIGSMNFIKISFATDCVLGLLLIVILATTGLKDRHFIDLRDKKVWIVNVISSALCIVGEFCCIKAIETGTTGPAIAIVSFNAILTSLLTWAINGVKLTQNQLIGVVISFLGVMIISLESGKNRRK